MGSGRKTIMGSCGVQSWGRVSRVDSGQRWLVGETRGGASGETRFGDITGAEGGS